MSQLKEIKEIIEWRNENMIEDPYATHLALDSVEDVINRDDTDAIDIIIDNIYPNEKFDIVCRAKNFDKKEIAKSIASVILSSDYSDKKEYIDTITIQEADTSVQNVECLFIHYDMLNGFSEWADAHIKEYDMSYEECKCLDWELYVFGDDLNEKQKEFIKLALQCGVERILIGDNYESKR